MCHADTLYDRARLYRVVGCRGAGYLALDSIRRILYDIRPCLKERKLDEAVLAVNHQLMNVDPAGSVQFRRSVRRVALQTISTSSSPMSMSDEKGTCLGNSAGSTRHTGHECPEVVAHLRKLRQHHLAKAQHTRPRPWFDAARRPLR